MSFTQSRRIRVGNSLVAARYSFCFALTLSFIAAPALAVVGDDHSEVVMADGHIAQVAPMTSWSVPDVSAKAWEAFRGSPNLESWKALWDGDTGIPLRLYGKGISVPGSVQSPEVAERAAFEFLNAQRELLAPGSARADFRVVANDLDKGMRTVGFVQERSGLPVVGGRFNVRFKNDRLFVVGSEALPNVPTPAVTRSPLLDVELGRRALAWVSKETGGKTKLEEIVGPAILPIREQGQPLRFQTVVEVVVSTRAPVGRYQVMLDIETGAPVSRRQLLKFYEGTVAINTVRRWPGGDRYDAPAPNLRVTAEEQELTASKLGVIDMGEQETLSVLASIQSNEITLINSAGDEITETLELSADQTTVWDHSDEEYEDAQLSAFISANIARDRARIIAPEMEWLLEESLQVTVNIEEETCNAYSDGTTINFFRGSRDCNNTARLADVVAHEFGHSFHAHAVIWGVGDFESALSEGASDYYAATIANDPEMGRGFFNSEGPLRRLDDRDRRWPEDIGSDPHETGIIFGGAMWDLREELKKVMGDEEGVVYADWLMYQALRRSANIPETFVEILAADDDDGDLLNGTPTLCTVVDAFAAHGLASPELSGGLQRPVIDGTMVRVPVASVACEGRGLQGASMVVWNRGESPSTAQTFDMPLVSGHYEVALPEADDGVVQMIQVKGTSLDGATSSYPQNPADPWYQVFKGDVETIYCTNFESEADLQEWSDELLEGENREGANDWMVGTPLGMAGSGDPDGAYSGDNVVGNDLGGGDYNGMYQPDKRNVLISPYIDVTGHENVRLQYRRWLNVEDGYYDQATIYANDAVAWQNVGTGDRGTLHHEDREWRFHDLDLTDYVERGGLEVKFEIKSDGGLEMGGWTIDDFCIVGFVPPALVDETGAGDAGDQIGDGGGGSDGADLKTADDEGCSALGANGVLLWMLLGFGLMRRRRD